jgi:Flp pilus assembly protein TadD
MHEECGRGWFPSAKVRLFVNDRRFHFVNPVHELVEPVLEKLGIKIETCDVPIQHYGRLDQDKLIDKGKEYFRLGIAKIEKMQGDYSALKELGIQAAEIGEYGEAMHIWQKVLDLKPQDPVAFMNMGYALLMLGQYEKAKIFSKNAMDLDPGLREAALNYAASELIAGEVKTAISTLDHLLEKHSDYPPAFGRMAAACLITGRKEDGLGYLDRLHARGFDCANVLEEQARALHAQGKNEQAVILLETALEKGMANGRIPALIGECRQEMKCSPPGL